MTTLSCSADGALSGNCSINQNLSITLALTQVGANVTGTIVAGGPTVTVSGSVANGHLSISGRGPVFPGVIDASYEDWDSTASGNAMTGTFTLVFYPLERGATGSARWRKTLTDVTRTP